MPRTATLDLARIEAANALCAERFQGLAANVPLWRLRDVLIKLGAELGLSGGAALYALDLVSMLREEDWRDPDSRPVTYASLRGYARKVGKSERTICEYERQLIAAGLAHRTLKHARRHGGAGAPERRTGLDWRAFGARMPELLERLAARAAEADRRRALEAELRSARQIARALLAPSDATPEQRALLTAHIPARAPLDQLEQRLAALRALNEHLRPTPAPTTDQSEENALLKDVTTKSSCSEDNADQERARKRTQGSSVKTSTSFATPSEQSLTLPRLWRAAPAAWRAALGSDATIDWPIFEALAAHMAPSLRVSVHAWRKAKANLGAPAAALALFALDKNRDHPFHPVEDVGAALYGIARRAETAPVDLAPSLHGVLARAERHARLTAPQPL